jgi:hypothetical protein
LLLSSFPFLPHILSAFSFFYSLAPSAVLFMQFPTIPDIPQQKVNQCFNSIFFSITLPLTGFMNNQTEQFLPVYGMTIN